MTHDVARPVCSLDMMDLSTQSCYTGTPTARLHASMWMIARSPLIYSGSVPAPPVNFKLMTNRLALRINERSSNLKVSYQGRCDCTPAPANNQFACTLLNPPGAAPCVAIFTATMPGAACKAVAVANLGLTTAIVHAPWEQLGIMAVDVDAPHNVTNVYDGTSEVVSALQVTVLAQGGELLLVCSA